MLHFGKVLHQENLYCVITKQNLKSYFDTKIIENNKLLKFLYPSETLSDIRQICLTIK